MGVKTIQLTENKGALAGALVVREHQELVFISQNGMVQRTSVRGINRYGRSSQGVKVMNIRDDDQVSAVALVVESETSTAATVAGDIDVDIDGTAGSVLAGDEAVASGEPGVEGESFDEGDLVDDDGAAGDDESVDGDDPAAAGDDAE
jgi:DNA gyrase subunit A